jgi:excisionase family DNA binding protein
VTEVAKLWDCSVQHVYNLIADGRLSVVDIGGGRRPKTRIAAAELDAYIKRNQRRAPRGRAA